MLPPGWLRNDENRQPPAPDHCPSHRRSNCEAESLSPLSAVIGFRTRFRFRSGKQQTMRPSAVARKCLRVPHCHAAPRCRQRARRCRVKPARRAAPKLGSLPVALCPTVVPVCPARRRAHSNTHKESIKLPAGIPVAKQPVPEKASSHHSSLIRNRGEEQT